MVLCDMHLDLCIRHGREQFDVWRTSGNNVQNMQNFVTVRFHESMQRPSQGSRQIFVDLNLQAAVTRDSNSSAFRTAGKGTS